MFSLCLPSTGIAGAWHGAWLFMWLLEILTQVPMVLWEVVYKLSYLTTHFKGIKKNKTKQQQQQNPGSHSVALVGLELIM